jgi:hypothetical protein
MAYPQFRSCNADLKEGITDGVWKKAAPDRGGEVEGTFAPVRKDMSGVWHGFNEKQPKIDQFGRSVSTGHYFDVTPMDSENV